MVTSLSEINAIDTPFLGIHLQRLARRLTLLTHETPTKPRPEEALLTGFLLASLDPLLVPPTDAGLDKGINVTVEDPLG